MQNKRSTSRTPTRTTRAGSILRWCLLSVMCVAILSCSDSSEKYSPLGGGDEAGSPAVLVTGIVRDMDDSPVVDAVVTLEGAKEGVPVAVIHELRGEEYGQRDEDELSAAALRIRATVTDADGRFAFDDVDLGEYILQAAADDHLGASRYVNVPDSPALAETVIVDVMLTPTGSLIGTALLENAITHESTIVFADGTSYVAVTDPSGAYEISGVPLGTYTVRATHPGYIDDSDSGTITTAGEQAAVPTLNLPLYSNIPPEAQITGPAGAGFTNFATDFAGTASDVDGTVVLYEWDFENDGIFDTADSSAADTNHVYTIPGTYTAKLRVTDNQGAIGLDAISIEVFDTEPGIYLSRSTGNDANTGTPVDPVRTLAVAYTRAGQQALDVIVADNGSYFETPVFQGGVDIKGGRSLPSWQQLGPNDRTNFFPGTNNSATANGIGLPDTTLISRVTVTAVNGNSANSIALYSTNSTGSLVFENCWFTAGNGGGRNPMGPGGNGLNGATGGNGFAGSCDGAHGNGGNGGSSPVGCPGGAGGRGGLEGSNAGLFGSTGFCGGGSGGFGGQGGVSDLLACPNDPGNTGGNGTFGANGGSGAGGTPASPLGSVIAGQWVPNTSGPGVIGTAGRGGGGGGGGGGQGGTCVDDGGGNGGGGGGGGAGPGTPGQGGNGGYASFAVFLHNSNPTFIDCVFDAGNGGLGGAGGHGGRGGTGGNGGIGAGVCTTEVGRGGNGGPGGNGGDAGGGAGGSGGPSFCVYRSNSTPNIVNPNYITGIGGPGGPGGQTGLTGPSAPSGLFGPSGALF